MMDKNQDGKITMERFVVLMTVLFSDNFEKLVSFIFRIYDRNKVGKIRFEDVKLILASIPILKHSKFLNFPE